MDLDNLNKKLFQEVSYDKFIPPLESVYGISPNSITDYKVNYNDIDDTIEVVITVEYTIPVNEFNIVIAFKSLYDKIQIDNYHVLICTQYTKRLLDHKSAYSYGFKIKLTDNS